MNITYNSPRYCHKPPSPFSGSCGPAGFTCAWQARLAIDPNPIRRAGSGRAQSSLTCLSPHLSSPLLVSVLLPRLAPSLWRRGAPHCSLSLGSLVRRGSGRPNHPDDRARLPAGRHRSRLRRPTSRPVTSSRVTSQAVTSPARDPSEVAGELRPGNGWKKPVGGGGSPPGARSKSCRLSGGGDDRAVFTDASCQKIDG